jgi:hypothetical protein
MDVVSVRTFSSSHRVKKELSWRQTREKAILDKTFSGGYLG